MRFSFIALTAFFFINIFAQKQIKDTYSFNFKNLSLQETLLEINSKTKLKLSYNPDIIPNIIINYKFKNTPLDEILDEILKTTKLDIQPTKKHIIIYERKDKITIPSKNYNKINRDEPLSNYVNLKENNNELFGRHDTVDFILFFTDTIQKVDSITIIDTLRFYDTLTVIDTICKNRKKLYTNIKKWKFEIETSFNNCYKKIEPNNFNYKPFTDTLNDILKNSNSFSTEFNFYRFFNQKYISFGIGYNEINQKYAYKSTPSYNGIYQYQFITIQAYAGIEKLYKNIGLFAETGLSNNISINNNINNSIFNIITTPDEIKKTLTVFQFKLNLGVAYLINQNSSFSLKINYYEFINSIYNSDILSYTYKGIGISAGLSIYL